MTPGVAWRLFSDVQLFMVQPSPRHIVQPCDAVVQVNDLPQDLIPGFEQRNSGVVLEGWLVLFWVFFELFFFFVFLVWVVIAVTVMSVVVWSP